MGPTPRPRQQDPRVTGVQKVLWQLVLGDSVEESQGQCMPGGLGWVTWGWGLRGLWTEQLVCPPSPSNAGERD